MDKVYIDGRAALGCLVFVLLGLLTCSGIVWAWRLLMTQVYGA
jgi:hypothetical protein